MEDLKIDKKQDIFFSPEVNFNASTGVCELIGESYLEETLKFYEPLYEWLTNYGNVLKKPLTFNFKLTYFNTSSSKAILDVLFILKDYEESGADVTVNWFYDTTNKMTMEEEVEDFSDETDLQINLLPFDN